MDKRKTYILMVDTETANGYTAADGKTHLEDSLVYDIGFAVIDKKGNIYEEYSFIIDEVFFKEEYLMQSAYYAEKIPMYYREMHDGIRKPVTIWEARRIVHKICEKYNIKAICAHNSGFDLRALNNTVRYYSKSKCRYFFPYGIEIWDTLKMCDVFAKSPSYVRYCKENGYMTNHKTPRPRKTAEILYRYISGDEEFNEKHTGLEDVRIETKILAHCFRQHKKMRKLLYA